MKKTLVVAVGAVLASFVSSDLAAQGKFNVPVTSPATVKVGGSATRPSAPVIVRHKSDVEKLRGGPKGPPPKPAGPSIGATFFSFMIGQTPSVASGITAGLHAPGTLTGASDGLKLSMQRRTSGGFEEVAQLYLAPPAGNSVRFECTVTPNLRYTTYIEAYIFATDKSEPIGTSTALVPSGTVVVDYEPVGFAFDILFVDLWSDSAFDLSGCKATRSG